MQKTHFSKAILCGPFVERKTKEAFCFTKAWSQYNTGISTTASLAQVAKALNGLDSRLFCPDAGSIRGGGRSIFFFHILFLYTFQSPRYLFIFVSL